MTRCGVVYVAFGENAQKAMKDSLKTLHKVSRYPTFIVDENTFTENPGFGARWAKLNIDRLAPKSWEYILYLDADTLVKSPIDRGFEILQGGDWDMALTMSLNQGGESLRHLDEEERLYTQRTLSEFFPLQLQLGVFYFNRETCKKFFEVWRKEWQRYKIQDQGAFLRALYRSPIKLWLLGRQYNTPYKKNAIVEHLFGRAVSAKSTYCL